MTGKSSKPNELSVKYKQKKVDKNIVLTQLETRRISVASSQYSQYKVLSKSLKAWSTSHYCGVDGTAIMLMYFDDNYSESYVATANESATALTACLIDNEYLLDHGLWGEDIVDGESPNSTGLNDYLNDRNVSLNAYAPTNGYSLSTVKSMINNNKPVMLATISSHPSYPDHWIIAHGYCTMLPDNGGQSYIIVNNGFGSNNVFVTVDSQYYNDIVYLS